MMSRLHRAKSIAAACIAAWALVACGGNDNNDVTGNATGVSGASATPANTGFSGQDASAPAVTNNIATDGLNWLNYRRAQVGMAALARNKQIDNAAQGHSDYQRINNVVTHEQTAGRQGFTGVRLQDRLAAANYVIGGSNAIGEVISAANKGTGFYMAEELITAIYHRFVIFEPVFKEAGAGSATTSAGYSYFTADFAASNGFGPGLATGMLAVWPVSGQTQVPPNFFSDYEEPDPVPDINEVGYPVSVHTNLTRRLTVQSFTMRARGGTAGNLATRLLAQGQDANTTTTSAAAIVPLAPLAARTTYDVTFIGAIDGTAVSRTWSFTTK
jgi:uncharacterized protein YkwD